MSAEVTTVAPPASVEATMLVVGAKRRKPNKVTQIQVRKKAYLIQRSILKLLYSSWT